MSKITLDDAVLVALKDCDVGIIFGVDELKKLGFNVEKFYSEVKNSDTRKHLIQINNDGGKVSDNSLAKEDIDKLFLDARDDLWKELNIEEEMNKAYKLIEKFPSKNFSTYAENISYYKDKLLNRHIENLCSQNKLFVNIINTACAGSSNVGFVDIHIEHGDWKHDHIFLDNLIKSNFNVVGLHKKNVEQIEQNGSDCYSATHSYMLENITLEDLYNKTIGHEIKLERDDMDVFDRS